MDKPKCAGCDKIENEQEYVWHNNSLWHMTCWIRCASRVSVAKNNGDGNYQQKFIDNMLIMNVKFRENVLNGNQKEIDKFIERNEKNINKQLMIDVIKQYQESHK